MGRNEIDYKSHEKMFGDMYHLVLRDINPSSSAQVKFLSMKDFPRFLSVEGNPIYFLHLDNELRIAEEYTIIYPKVFVKRSRPLVKEDVLTDSYLH